MIQNVIRELDFNGEGGEDQCLVQRKRRKRALESPKKADVEVPAKRT